MSDPDVERELEANRRRDEDGVAGEREGGGDDDALLDPLTRVFRGPADDDEDLDEEQREQNDEEQRRGE